MLIALFGLLVYGKRLDAAAVVGMALIVTSVVVINALSEIQLH